MKDAQGPGLPFTWPAHAALIGAVCTHACSSLPYMHAACATSLPRFQQFHASSSPVPRRTEVPWMKQGVAVCVPKVSYIGRNQTNIDKAGANPVLTGLTVQ